MNLAIAYDTETTGLPDWNQPSEAPQQPHLVQLAAHVIDLDSRKILQSMDVIIKPNGWVIPDEVSAIHGITTEHAMDVGIDEGTAVLMFIELWNHRTRIAHNESFDARIIRIALKRYLDFPDLLAPDQAMSDTWKAGSAECTARLSTPICALPPTDKMKAARRNHHKTPNLGEAYRHFTGKELENAHTAIADVNACLAIYWAIKDQEKSAA